MDKCIGLFAVLQTLITQSDKDHPIKRSKTIMTLRLREDISTEFEPFSIVWAFLPNTTNPGKVIILIHRYSPGVKNS